MSEAGGRGEVGEHKVADVGRATGGRVGRTDGHEEELVRERVVAPRLSALDGQLEEVEPDSPVVVVVLDQSRGEAGRDGVRGVVLVWAVGICFGDGGALREHGLETVDVEPGATELAPPQDVSVWAIEPHVFAVLRFTDTVARALESEGEVRRCMPHEEQGGLPEGWSTCFLQGT